MLKKQEKICIFKEIILLVFMLVSRLVQKRALPFRAGLLQVSHFLLISVSGPYLFKEKVFRLRIRDRLYLLMGFDATCYWR
jgi:hypothetical protein